MTLRVSGVSRNYAPTLEPRGAGCEAIRRPCCLLMIRFVLVQNRQGKVRLAKYYVRMDEAEKAQIPGEVFRVIAPRDQRSQATLSRYASAQGMRTLVSAWEREVFECTG